MHVWLCVKELEAEVAALRDEAAITQELEQAAD